LVLNGVELALVGSFRLTIGGREVDAGPARQRTLLAALAVDAGQRVPLGTLIDRIWGEAPPTAAREGVYAYVTRLRQVFARAGLPTSPLRSGSGGYALDLEADRVDLLRFQRLVADARLDRYGEESRAAALERALELCRGPALADLSGSWVQRTRELLEQQRLDALLLWAALLLRLGRPGDVIGPLRELAGQHPLVEPVAARLIEALARDGRPAEALASYAEIRRVLVAQLGTEPGIELRRLHQAILVGDLENTATAVTAPAEPPAPAERRPAQLPRDISAFTGRRDELNALDEALVQASQEPAAVLVATITGTAGVGKTALAVHWAHQMRHRFPDGQLYVDLRGFAPSGRTVTPAHAILGFLDGLGVPATQLPADLDAQAALYRSLLAGRRVLVVLDNARDADQVRPLLPGEPGCVVVVTSRNRLSALVADGAHPVNVGLFTATEAREVLSRRLGADRVAAEPAAAWEIVVRCARLPLALTIATARALQSGFPLGAVAAELSDVRDRLDAVTPVDLTDEVGTAFSWSYDRLTPAAARLFRLLGLLAGPDISATAAAEIAGLPRPQVQRLLAGLAGASLITEHAPGRYTLHDLLRAYAAELSRRVDTEEERRVAAGRLLDHYCRTAYAAERRLSPQRDPASFMLCAGAAGPAAASGPDQFSGLEQAMAWLGTEHEVLLSAIRQAAEYQLDAQVWQLAWSLDTFLFRRGRWHEFALVWLAAERAADRLGDPAAHAYAQGRLGTGYLLIGRFADANVHFRSALDGYQQAGDRIGLANTHRSFATLAERQGQPEGLLTHGQQALALFQAAGDDRGLALTYNTLGWYHAQYGEPDQALVLCEQALALARRFGDYDLEAHIWDTIGYARNRLGDHAEAADSYQHALDLFNDVGDRYNQACTLSHLGDDRHADGELEAARAAWQRALDILTDLDHPDAAEVSGKLRAIGADG
jgi:DNA-binding SARP family transcriptional activator/tetratricopeptide (TPR) repeat protein